VRDGDSITGFQCKDGKFYTGIIILATGAWTSSLLSEAREVMTPNGQPVIHIKIPEPLQREFKGCPVWGADLSQLGFYGFPPTDGIVKIAHHGAGYKSHKGVKTIVTDPSTGAKVPLGFIQRFREFLDAHLPSISGLDIASTRICWYCDTWDGDFYITKVPAQPRLILAAGGSGHAFKFMPVIGDIVADVVEGKSSSRTKRFQWRTPQSTKKQESSRSAVAGQQYLEEVRLAEENDLKSKL
jgi:glycine/D-amino acid oxidase-like deaminating enzyme